MKNDQLRPFRDRVSKLQTVIIETNGKVQSAKGSRCQYIYKNQAYEMIKDYFASEYQQHTRRVDYFRQQINPIYSSIMDLPIKIYVCGFCKSFFCSNLKYLTHCYCSKCPLNHERSTYYFYLHNNSIQNEQLKKYQIIKSYMKTQRNQMKQRNNKILATNYDLQQYFNKDNDITFRKSQIMFLKQLINYQIYPNPNYQGSKKNHKCGKCRKQFSMQYNPKYFALHCLYKCQSTQNINNTHFVKIIKNNQQNQQFFEDIKNLVLNFNVFALMDNFYLKIEINQRFKQSRQKVFFCSNCQSYLNSQNQYLKHVIFVCKNQPNKKSCHNNVKKILQIQNNILNPQPLQKKFLSKQLDKQKLIIQTNNHQKKQKQIIQIDLDLNQHLFDQNSQFFKQIYFCGYCFNVFYQKQPFLIHFSIFNCPLNHPKNSHSILNPNTKQQIDSEQLNKMISFELKDNFIQNHKYYNNLLKQMIIMDKKSQKIIKRRSQCNFYCGKCKKNIQRKSSYHILRLCKSYENPQNSHILKLKQIKKSSGQLKNFIKSLYYAQLLVKNNPNKFFRIVKQPQIHQGSFCGKCDTQFKNIYQFVYHCVQICKSLQMNHLLSHKITVQQQQQQLFPSFKVINQISNRQYNFQGASQYSLLENPRRSSKRIHYQVNDQKQSDQQTQSYCIQEKQQQQKMQQDDNEPQTRYLIKNIDFFTTQTTKYYCFPCNQTFKRQNILLQHIQFCQNYQSKQSSHYYLTLEKIKAINKATGVTKIQQNKNTSIFSKHISKTYNMFCGCGMKLSSSQYSLHMKCNHRLVVPEGSSHIIIKLKKIANCPPQCFYIPINLTSEGLSTINIEQYRKQGLKNNDMQFVCPCDTHNYMKIEEFIQHVLARHKGISPLFHMRKNQAFMG